MGAWGDSRIFWQVFFGGEGWLDLRRDFFGRN